MPFLPGGTSMGMLIFAAPVLGSVPTLDVVPPMVDGAAVLLPAAWAVVMARKKIRML